MENRHLSYLAAVAADWLALGFFTIAMSWLVVKSGSGSGSVGIFWFCTSLSSLVFTPVFGALLDRPANHFRVLGGAQAFRFLALVGLQASDALWDQGDESLAALLIVASLFGPANSLANVSLDAIVLGAQDSADRARTVKRAALVRQVALGLGFAAAGSLMAILDPKATAALGGLFCICSLLFARTARPMRLAKVDHPRKSFWERLSRGGRVILGNRQLLVPVLLVVAAFSISQITNALLAPILAAQGKTPAEFGLMESVWTLGAIGAASVLAARGSTPLRNQRAVVQLIALGALCVLFALTDSTAVQLVIFACMGALFSMVRIDSAAAIAEAADADCIGPVQASSAAAVSAVALLMYGLPTLLQRSGPVFTYLISGVIVMALGSVVLVWIRTWATGIQVASKGG